MHRLIPRINIKIVQYIVVSLVEKFPLLKKKINDLSKDEKDELLLRLNHESKAILDSFAQLVTRTQMYLRHSEATTEDLKKLLIEREMKELVGQIESTDTIPMILSKIKQGNYWSFFNYELLASIITCFCRETHLIAELEEYVSEFKVYCQRRVSEVPSGSLSGEQSDKQSSSTFKVKMDDTFRIQETNLEQLKSIQYKLQKVLNMNPLLLVDVEGGCIELTFRYFENAMAKLLPLREAEKIALSKIGVQCFNEEVVLKTKATAISAQPPSSLPATDFTGNYTPNNI